MNEVLEKALSERLDLLARIGLAFTELFPTFPKKIPRGEAQKRVLEEIGVFPNGNTRRAVSEALQKIGYRRVKIRGFYFYRLGDPCCIKKISS